MKSSFVSDLGAEQTITSYFLVNEKEIRNTRAGKSFLRLALGDRSGTIEAVMWDQYEAPAKDISRDDIVKVNARVEIYRNKPQLTLQQLRLAKPEEVDLADFLPQANKLLPVNLDWKVDPHVTANLRDQSVDVDLQYSVSAPK